VPRAPLSWAPLLACVALVACRPTLSRTQIAEHPGLRLGPLGAVVVEASEPLRPSWVTRSDREPTADVEFIGQASADAVDTARAEAMRDLLSSVASFVAVEVESTFESVETHDRGQESQALRSEVRTRAQAGLRDVRADRYYWERVAASPLDTTQTTVRYYVHARVPRAEISRVRLEKQLARQRESGRTMVAIAPVVPTVEVADAPAVAALARAIGEDLGRALAAEPSLHVVEPAVVGSVLPAARSDEGELAVIQDALLADRVVSATLQRVGDDLAVRWSVRSSGDQPSRTGVVRGRVAALFSLEAELARAVRAALVSSPAPSSGAQVVPDDLTPAAEAAWSRAEQLSAAAWDTLEAGQSEAALAQIYEALALRPGHAPTLIRLGRMLERLGRYARITPVAAQQARPSLLTCRHESAAAAQEAVGRLRTRAMQRAVGDGLPAWIQPTTPTIDAVLDRVAFTALGVYPSEPELARPTAAASAYMAAWFGAGLTRDRARTMEALLALADLAVRVDRPARGLVIHNRLLVVARDARDHHYLSLVHYGMGVAKRRLGLLDEAQEHLGHALAERALLGEKPYLLEIYNELGGTTLEREDLAGAAHYYRRAQRLADELDLDYLRAVLGNNLGVLAWRTGRTAEAEELFAAAHATLSAARSAEGTLVVLLNWTEARARRGDPESARRWLDEAQRVVDTTDQEGRRLVVAARSGTFLALSGQPVGALAQHHEALSLAGALGQTRELRRAHGAVLGDEARLPDLTDDTLDCLRQAHAVLDAPHVPGQETAAWETRAALADGTELALAHDALVVGALASGVDARDPRFGHVTPDGLGAVAYAEAVLVSETSDRRRRVVDQRPPPRRDPPRRLSPPPRDPSAGPALRPEDQPPPRPAPDRHSVTPTRPGTSATDVDIPAREREAAPRPDEPAGAAATPRTTYDRMISAFDVASEPMLLLTPEALPRLRLAPFPTRLVRLAALAKQRQLRRLEASARLNLAALSWRQGRERDAYRSLMEARRGFAALGDTQGLAVSHRWLGLMMRDSDAVQPAVDNLALAHQLYLRLEDSAGADAVLRTGSD
jgi:tetratricopeptide (TPR) repeat protein